MPADVTCTKHRDQKNPDRAAMCSLILRAENSVIGLPVAGEPDTGTAYGRGVEIREVTGMIGNESSIYEAVVSRPWGYMTSASDSDRYARLTRYCDGNPMLRCQIEKMMDFGGE